MSSGKPPWMRAAAALERLAAPPLEGAVRSDLFVHAVTAAERLRRQIALHGEQFSRPVLHAMNLPTGSDTVRLLRRIAGVERRVRELTRAVEGLPPQRGDEIGKERSSVATEHHRP